MSHQEALEAINDFFEWQIDALAVKKTSYKMKDIQIISFIYCAKNHWVTISNLAKHFHISTAAASQFMNEYEEKGWINRIRFEKDHRIVYVQLTDKVLNQIDEWKKQFQTEIEDVFDSFNDDEIYAFLRILHSLNEQMESNFNH